METLEFFENKSIVLSETLGKTLSSQSQNLLETVQLFNKTLLSGNTIFWCGNGGSASESSHLAAELIGRFKRNRIPLASISLNSDTSAITCIANDFGYDEIFARQLEGIGKAGDLLIVLSTSGMSGNILRVLKQARVSQITSIAILGKGGGEAKSVADISVVVESDETARIQEVHLFIGHTLCELGEKALGF